MSCRCVSLCLHPARFWQACLNLRRMGSSTKSIKRVRSELQALSYYVQSMSMCDSETAGMPQTDHAFVHVRAWQACLNLPRAGLSTKSIKLVRVSVKMEEGFKEAGRGRPQNDNCGVRTRRRSTSDESPCEKMLQFWVEAHKPHTFVSCRHNGDGCERISEPSIRAV